LVETSEAESRSAEARTLESAADNRLRRVKPVEGFSFHHIGEEHVERAEKKELVATFGTAAKSAGVIVVAHNKGLTANQVLDLRNKMAAAIKVVKNRLAKIALADTDANGISNLFEGPTMVAYGADPVAAPKVASDFAKGNEKFVVLGGALGKTVMDAKAVKSLAELPSLDQLRGKLIGLIQAPATKIAGVLQAPAGQLARVIGAYAAKQ
jgi:large subunit ribosomal protein L10